MIFRVIPTAVATAMLMTAFIVSAQKTVTAEVINLDSPVKMAVFLPEKTKATGRMIVNFPGGGYSMVATEHEGTDWSEYFNEMGIAYAVVNYRMPNGDRNIPITDAENAIREARKNAEKWNINPNDIGIMGFSAGGHLASTVATHSTGNAVPNFQILIYPVISMMPELTHEWSHDNFLGKDATQSLNRDYSSELNVTEHTPRAYIALCGDDTCVKPMNSIAYFEALMRHGVPATLHVYDSGDHGWGLRNSFKYHDQMLSDLCFWLSSF